MKKFLLTSLAALIAVVSFAQPRVMMQLPSSDMLKAQVVEKRLTPKASLKGVVAPERTKVLGKAASRRAKLSSIDELNGDFVVANSEYDVDSTMQFIPADVAYSGSAVTIEVTGENTIAIYGFTQDATNAINATIDLETSTISIPSGQVLFTHETYGDIFIENVTSEGDLKGTVYEGGIIALEDAWIDELVYQGNTYYWGNFFHFSTIAPANGVMEYESKTSQNGGYEPQTLNVLIVQDEETKEVTVFNFSVWGLGATISLNSDKTFVLSSDNAVDYGGSEYGLYYIVGTTDKGRLYLDVPGKGTTTTLKSDDYWSLYSYEGYWRFAQAPFTITLIDGSEFAYPPAETGELVTPPAGLQTKEYPFSALVNAEDDYSATVKVGIDGNNVYIQGLDKDLPEAWVKGEYYKESKTLVAFPVTYTGLVGEGEVHYFAAYGGSDGPDSLFINYDAEADTYDYGATVMIYKGTNPSASYAYFYNGFFIGEKPTPVTAPEGLETKEMPFAGKKYNKNSKETEGVEGNVKVGIDGDNVYIQGLFTEVKTGWMKGTLTTVDGAQYVMFEKNQYIGNLENGLSAYIVGYNAGNDETPASAYYAIFAYDAQNNVFKSLNPILLTRFKDNVSSFETYFSSGLTIGTEPDGIAVTKSDVKSGNAQMFNLAGQRVSNDYKGLVIKNGRKVLNK